MVILVVEDDPLINLTACNELQDAGYEAIPAFNADEAIEILKARNDIRLLFTDIEMEGSIDGLKLAAFVRDRWPPVHIIVTSGRKTPDDAALPERAVFVPKPYRMEHILETIDDFN